MAGIDDLNELAGGGLPRRRADLRALARNPNFISGIFNYCDRWCERCPMTARCLLFAQEQASGMADVEKDVRNEAFWKALSASFQQTIEMIRADAAERGIDLTISDEEAKAFEEQEERRDARVRADALAEAGEDYMAAVHGWFKANRGTFEAKGQELVQQAEMALPGADPAAAAQDIADATEVVQWYHMQIGVKLQRALSSLEEDEEEDLADEDDEDGEAYPSDSDGSAKVALIGIDRSLSAWARLRERMPEQGDVILDFLVTLDRLRRATEQRFPKARAFVRPGFDDGASPEPPVKKGGAASKGRGKGK